MNPDRRTALHVGALFLLATATFFTSNVLLTPILEAPDLVASVAQNSSLVIGAALLALADGVAVLAIAALLFPILARRDQAAAVAYLGVRVAEFAIISVYVLSPLLLVTLGQDASAPHSQPAGALLLGLRYWTLLFIYLFNGLAGLPLCWVFLRTGLVPRWLAVLGLVGYAVIIPAAVLNMFGLVDTVAGAGLLALLPGGLFELLLPFWLFIKGFNMRSSRVATLSGEEETAPIIYTSL